MIGTSEPAGQERGGRVVRILRLIDHFLFPRGNEEWDLLRSSLLPDCRRVLDVGCGTDGSLLSIAPSIPFSLGVDLKLPAESSRVHDEYRELDVRDLGEHFGQASFDAAVALDVIEHLSKEDGLKLLTSMERIAAKRVVIFTPNGFLSQPPDDDNPWQEHVSGWTVDDFEARGYRVVGINGWKPLRGSYAAVRWRPAQFWWRLSLASQRFVRSRPRWAFQLLAVRSHEERE